MAKQNSINANSTTPLSAEQGGSGVSNPTTGGILVAKGSAAFATKVLTDGQLLIGSTGNDPVGAALNAGAGISILNGVGSITVSSTVVGMSFAVVSGTTQAAVANTVYSCQNVALTTVTLPAAPVAGDVVEVRARTSAGVSVVAGSGTQVIEFGNIASAAGGSATSVVLPSGVAKGGSLTLECEVGGASAIWQVVASQGNFDVV